MPSKKKPTPAQVSPTPKTPISQISPEQQIVGATFLGKILDYYSNLEIITLLLEAPLSIGDTIRIKGHKTDLTQKVESLQIAHAGVQSAMAGESVEIKVADKSRPGDAVYKC